MSTTTLRKRLAVVAVVALTASVALAGCSTSSSSAAAGGKATITLAMWDSSQQAGVQKAVSAFEKANPDITVKLQDTPSAQYYTKLNASLSAKGGPDVMWQSSHAEQYVDGGALEPLDSYIKKDNLSLSGYPSKITKLYTFNGKQYGIPKDQDAWSFIYNKATFAKLGVTDLPTSTWTWADMVRISKELRAKMTSSSVYPVYIPTSFNSGVASLVQRLGSTVVKNDKGNTSTSEATKALEMIKALQDEKLEVPAADATTFDQPSALISGTVAMAEVPSWLLSEFSSSNLPSGTMQAVPMPSTDGSVATDTNGLSYTMNANSKYKDADWKLIKFMTSDEGAKLQEEGGAALSASTDPSVLAAFYKAHDSIGGLEAAFKPMLQESYLRTTTHYPATVNNFPDIEAEVGSYYAGSVSVSTAESKIDDLLTTSFK